MKYPANNNLTALVLTVLFLLMIAGQGVAFARSPEVRTEKEVYAPNEEIVIFFEHLPGNPRDWIALAKSGAPDQRPLGRYTYLNGMKSGRTSLRGFGAGEYEVRAYKGGSKEVLARYSFRIGVTTASAVDNSVAKPQTQGTAPNAPATTASEAVQTSPAKPLQPAMQRLLGKWIGQTRCDITGSGGARPQELLLSVRQDGAKPSGVSAEVMGIDSIAGIVLDITLDEGRQQYRLDYAGWQLTGGGTKWKPYGLRMAFLKDRELLYGKIISKDFQCASVVAGKLPEEGGQPNPQGLLSKVAGNRHVLEPLTEEDCVAYGRWLATGELSQAYGSALLFNSAVGDAAAMRRVLGHDLGQWTDDDTRKIRVIHGTCRMMLKKSSDPAIIDLINREKRIWGGVAPPLTLPKAQYPRNWRDTYKVLNRLLMVDIRKTWELLEEGLLRESGTVKTAEVQPAHPLNGEWRGYYQCEGSNEVFMRLMFPAAGNPLDVRFESGSSLKTIQPFGVLAMNGAFDASSGRLDLQPGEWILEPRGQNRSLGLQGSLSEDGNTISGQVKGNPTCSDFTITRREVKNEPVNQDGLLFHYLARDMITADLPACLDYAEWLAAGEEINLGGTYIFSGIRDADATRAVLGKDLFQWDTDDWQKMNFLSRHCKALLESQMDAEIAELLAQIKEKRLVWAPAPLSIPREERPGLTTTKWLLVEQLVMVNTEQRELAASKLAEVENQSAGLASIDRIDALTKEAGRRLQGPLGYLSPQELDAYLSGLQAARVKTAAATADTAANAWQRRPETYAGLEQVEDAYNELRQGLEKRKAMQGVNLLDAHFRRVTDQRADALWPEVLRLTVSELQALAEANLLRFKDLGDDQERQVYLSRFHPPGKPDHYYADYQAASSLYRQTVDRMVDRSIPQLLAWIDDLPPSAGANNLLDEFAKEVYGLGSIPERHLQLKQAVMAKKRSYNPDRYLRPDIVMSLKRGQWNEVGLVGLEDLAYVSTSLRAIKNTCPRAVPEASEPLMSFFWNLAQQSVRRVFEGKVQSRQEASRVIFLFMNTAFNQPGCRVNYLGAVIGCVSEEEHAAVQEFFMTSSDAQKDMRTLLRAGCGSEGGKGYVQGLVAYAEGARNLPPGSTIRNFWTWTAH